jgi:hypothetical protein
MNAYLELEIGLVDRSLELLGQIRYAPNVFRRPRVKPAILDDLQHTRNDGGGDHGGDEVGVVEVVGWTVAWMRVLVQRRIPLELL